MNAMRPLRNFKTNQCCPSESHWDCECETNYIHPQCVPVCPRGGAVSDVCSDSRRVISAPILVSLGDHRTAAVQVGEVFSSALKVDAKAVIVAHNHPSGDPTPSSEDIEVTRKLIEASNLVDVALLDHIVLGAPGSAGGNGYVSIVGTMK